MGINWVLELSREESNNTTTEKSMTYINGSVDLIVKDYWRFQWHFNTIEIVSFIDQTLIEDELAKGEK